MGTSFWSIDEATSLRKEKMAVSVDFDFLKRSTVSVDLVNFAFRNVTLRAENGDTSQHLAENGEEEKVVMALQAAGVQVDVLGERHKRRLNASPLSTTTVNR